MSSLGIDLSFDEQVLSGAVAPLAQPYVLPDRKIGNRFAVYLTLSDTEIGG